MVKIVIFISGRGSNMEALLKSVQNGILKGVATPVLVFSNNPEAAGLNIAKSHAIKTEVIDSQGKKRTYFDREVMQLLQNYEFDFIILAGYMRILTAEFIRNFPQKIINIHPADTKLHQGLHAYEWAFANHLETTKITVHYVNEGVDTGIVIAQKSVDLRGVKSLEEVEKKGLAVEHQFYAETLYKIFKNHKNN